MSRSLSLVICLLTFGCVAPDGVKPGKMSRRATVAVAEVSDYVFGNYSGTMPSPPHADGNPKRAIIVSWSEFPFRFVFAHEGSYCPWFEFPSGAGHCYQFFEGNDGWAELFNDFGRREENSFVNVMEAGPKRVWVRWTYYGVNQHTGQRAYRATEDFWAFPNGHVLRGQSYETLMPGDHRGYAREPIEIIEMCPKGKLWFDILRPELATGESHAMAALDVYSTNRYDLFWKYTPGTLLDSTVRRAGCAWKTLDDSPGVALITPLRDGAPFCVMGDAGGYGAAYTRLKEHSFTDTGGQGWGSLSWDHWPIGWLNSQGHPVTAETLKTYPNHFSPVGMDLFALPNDQVNGRVFYSLVGVGGDNLEEVRSIARQWLDLGANCSAPDLVQKLPATFR